MQSTFIDFHCHPSMKPYGKSFKSGLVNSSRRKDKNSIWHYDPPNLFERALQSLAGINKFTQSDMTTLAYSDVGIACASFYPIERGFFRNKLGTATVPGDLLTNFVTGVGKARVDFVQSVQDYFSDLEHEYAFYRQLDGAIVNTDSGDYKYRLITSFAQIEAIAKKEANTLFIIPTIEGLHALHSNIDDVNPQQIMQNAAAIKQWQHPPFFITFSHHFYNHLCGHAKSLTDLVGAVSDQTEGINTGFTPLGLQVLDKLLHVGENEKRVHIDIKHMSAIARKEYFHLLQTTYSTEQIPVMVSHGAANGLRSFDEPVADLKITSPKLLADDINFYDNEIVLIAKTGGIFCFQLDERRIASKQTLRNTKHAIPLNKIRHYRAELLWNQVQHIAELLDSHDLFAWDIMAIGSDFDGIINPLNGYLTAETLQHLQAYTERYAFNYMNERGKQVLKPYNIISASDIVNRIFTDNGLAFLQKWFV